MTTQQPPQDHHELVASGSALHRYQSSWSPAANGRYMFRLSLDRHTTALLLAAQSLGSISPDSGHVFSRTSLVRRAILLYCQRLIQANRLGLHDLLSDERDALFQLTQTSKRPPQPQQPKSIAHDSPAVSSGTSQGQP